MHARRIPWPLGYRAGPMQRILKAFSVKEKQRALISFTPFAVLGKFETCTKKEEIRNIDQRKSPVNV